jgi:hypothetical protein
MGENSLSHVAGIRGSLRIGSGWGILVNGWLRPVSIPLDCLDEIVRHNFKGKNNANELVYLGMGVRLMIALIVNAVKGPLKTRCRQGGAGL